MRRLIRSENERLEVRRNVESKKTIRIETTIRSKKTIKKERICLEVKDHSSSSRALRIFIEQSHDDVYGCLKGGSRNSGGKRLAISMVEEAWLSEKKEISDLDAKKDILVNMYGIPPAEKAEFVDKLNNSREYWDLELGTPWMEYGVEGAYRDEPL
ncbi:hypothetical protein Tco_0007988 [Tanacetum coccineum]